MPSLTKLQRKFMAIADKDPDFAKKAGIPHKVAHEFHEADLHKEAEEHHDHENKKD